MVPANTQSAAIAGAKSTFGIRHTNGARVAIQEARTALGLAWRYMDAFETEAPPPSTRLDLQLDEMRDFAARLVKAGDKTGSHRVLGRPPCPGDRGDGGGGRPQLDDPAGLLLATPACGDAGEGLCEDCRA